MSINPETVGISTRIKRIRKFGRFNYSLDNIYRTKRYAQKIAKDMRNRMMRVRVVPVSDGYAIYYNQQYRPPRKVRKR